MSGFSQMDAKRRQAARETWIRKLKEVVVSLDRFIIDNSGSQKEQLTTSLLWGSLPNNIVWTVLMTIIVTYILNGIHG
jgi:hypothetical protein